LGETQRLKKLTNPYRKNHSKIFQRNVMHRLIGCINYPSCMSKRGLAGSLLAFILGTLLASAIINATLYRASANSDNDSRSGISVIIGTRSYTKGTDGNDVIIGCQAFEASGPGCQTGDTIHAERGNDVIQGSSLHDNLYGDEDKDEVTGADGNDELYGGPNNDVLQAGFGGDFLVGGPGNDELYGGAGDDVLIGGRGADYFDCGDGQDTIVDFNPAKGDTQAGNCEIVLTESGNIEFAVQYGKDKLKIQSFGVGSFKDPTDINELGESIN
jgi:Ca2+-binding RTX toxin-like protein